MVNIQEIINQINSEQNKRRERFFIDENQTYLFQLLEAYYKKNVMERGATDFSDDDEQKRRIKDISDWLSDPNKKVGLMMMGKVGTGKTMILKALCQTINVLCRRKIIETESEIRPEETLNPPYLVSMYSAKQVVDFYNDTNNYGNRYKYELMQKVRVLAIDELGTEPTETKQYGNTSRPIIDLISARYERQLCTMITTNCNITEIAGKYGDRIADRVKEMFLPVAFNGSSYRIT